MSFLAGLSSIFGKILNGVEVATGIVHAAAPEIALIPVYGPVINMAVQLIFQLEAILPASGFGPVKAAVAVPALVAAHPEVTTAQAQALIASLVAGFNAAGEAAAAKAP